MTTMADTMADTDQYFRTSHISCTKLVAGEVGADDKMKDRGIHCLAYSSLTIDGYEHLTGIQPIDWCELGETRF